MASNPVLRGFEKTGRPGVGPSNTQTLPAPGSQRDNSWYAPPPNYGQQAGYGHQPASGQQFAPPGGVPPQAASRYLTLDDVISRCVLLIATVLVAAGFVWFAVPESAYGGVLILGLIAAGGLGLYIAFTGKATAATTITYAVAEGVLLGAISNVFNQRWPGIVVQAVVGTVMVAGGVLVVYKTGAVRVTPKFTRIVAAATLGALGLMVVNLVASIFHSGGLGLRDSNQPALAIGFSLLCIVIAASNLIIDFDGVEQSVRRGVDERYGWYLSFGILVTLVWLYLEILRLLSYLRGND